jgi:hypothetical protein
MAARARRGVPRCPRQPDIIPKSLLPHVGAATACEHPWRGTLAALRECFMDKRVVALVACSAVAGAAIVVLVGAAGAEKPGLTSATPLLPAAPQPMNPEQPMTPEIHPLAVRVNGTALTDEQVKALALRYRTAIASGEYWYDARTGLWGTAGGPALGLLMPGEPIGGALQANVSGGGTAVFINGRELHPVDVRNLDTLFAAFGTRTLPGRYWSDASGNFGHEGNTLPLGNFREMVARAGGNAGQSGSYRNNPWSYTTDYTAFGSDGSTSYFESKKTYGADKGTTGVYIDENGSVSYD